MDEAEKFGRPKGRQRVGLPEVIRELDLERLAISVNFDDRAHLSTIEAKIGARLQKRHRVEELQHRTTLQTT